MCSYYYNWNSLWRNCASVSLWRNCASVLKSHQCIHISWSKLQQHGSAAIELAIGRSSVVLVFRQIPFYINECETCIRWITRHCEPQKPQRSMALSHFLKKCGREPGNWQLIVDDHDPFPCKSRWLKRWNLQIAFREREEL